MRNNNKSRTIKICLLATSLLIIIFGLITYYNIQHLNSVQNLNPFEIRSVIRMGVDPDYLAIAIFPKSKALIKPETSYTLQIIDTGTGNIGTTSFTWKPDSVSVAVRMPATQAQISKYKLTPVYMLNQWVDGDSGNVREFFTSKVLTINGLTLQQVNANQRTSNLHQLFYVLLPIDLALLAILVVVIKWKINTEKKKQKELMEAEKIREEEERKRVEAQKAEIERQRIEEERKWQEAVAEHLVKIYECYGCGKTEVGKDLDTLYESNTNERWYAEWKELNFYQIYQVPLPQPDIRIYRMYCDKCGKARERELELLNVELRKIKAMNNQADAIKKNTRVEEEKLEEQNRLIREQKDELDEQNRLMREQIETTEEIKRVEENRNIIEQKRNDIEEERIREIKRLNRQ